MDVDSTVVSGNIDRSHPGITCLHPGGLMFEMVRGIFLHDYNIIMGFGSHVWEEEEGSKVTIQGASRSCTI